MRTNERRSRGERGAALVEFALVLPLLLMLVFGIIEFGLVFNHRLTIGNATQSAARVGSAVANGDYADMAILESIEQGIFYLPNQGQQIVKQVYVFKADASGSPYSTCPSTDCNIYTYTYDAVGCNWSPCPDTITSPTYWDTSSGKWKPENRNAAVGNLDVLGVRMLFAHDWVIGSFLPLTDVTCTTPPSNCWSDTALMRLEPQQLGVTP